MNISEFLNDAPKFITSRFSSINKYVWESLFPESFREELIKKKKNKKDRKEELSRLKSISDEASIIVFLFLINKFFLDGSKAAKQAVDTLKDLNVDGFYIGQSYFSERNKKVLQGEQIAALMISSIKEETVRNLILKSNYVSEILDEYRKVIYRNNG